MARRVESERDSFMIKVTLLDTEPAVWRRVEVPARFTLHKLHAVVQLAMGWENAHLYEFELRKQRFGPPEPDWGGGRTLDDRRVTLSALGLKPRQKFRYLYDMGDSWRHEILVEQRVSAAAASVCARCVDGERACPPEDCGGAGGYEELVEAISDPEHEQHEERLEWAGGSFDAAAFDREKVDAALSRLR